MIPSLAKILTMLVGKNLGRRRRQGHQHLRHYYRAGGALLARGKYVPPSERHICFGEHGCKCWKHLKHAKRSFITS